MPTPTNAAPAASSPGRLARTVLDLGRGTQVRINDFGEVVDLPDGSGRMSLDYTFVRRGRLSRGAIRKRLQRIVIGCLVCKLAAVGEQPDPKWEHRVRRERRWLDRHLKPVMPDPTAAPSPQGPCACA